MSVPPPSDDKRCKAVRHGERCKNYAVTGLTVCRHHGGGTQRSKAKSERIKLVASMQKFATPLDPSDPLNDPITGFESEYRRTMGRILWYDEQLAKLQADELVWGRTKTEEVGASEFTGQNETFEARANLLHELQFRERQHLLSMQKVWIGARLGERKLEIQRAHVVALDKAMVGILSALGLDPGDPTIRQVVRDQLLALPVGAARE